MREADARTVGQVLPNPDHRPSLSAGASMAIKAVALLVLAASTLTAQWRGGGNSRPHWGTSQVSGRTAFANYSYSVAPLYRQPLYAGGYYSYGYGGYGGYGLPFTQVMSPYPTSGNGGPSVIVIQA